MKIYFDENLPPHLAKGFQTLQEPEGLRSGYPVTVLYLPIVFGRGAKDLDWIARLEPGDCVITKDININRRKHELELYRRRGIGMFFLKGKSKKNPLTVWEIVQALAKNWPDISRIVYEADTPFAYVVTLHRKIKSV